MDDQRTDRESGGIIKPQLGIRALLLLTAFVAISIGWFEDRQRLTYQLRAATQANENNSQIMRQMTAEIERYKPENFNGPFPERPDKK